MTRRHQKRLVLYADDDVEDLAFVREALKHEANHIELITFADASDLLKFSRMSARGGIFPCLVMLDINMPNLNGKEALSMLREMDCYSSIPAVLFTTSTMPSDSAFAERYGAELITKPLNAQQMDLIVDRLLRHCGNGVKSSYS